MIRCCTWQWSPAVLHAAAAVLHTVLASLTIPRTCNHHACFVCLGPVATTYGRSAYVILSMDVRTTGVCLCISASYCCCALHGWKTLSVVCSCVRPTNEHALRFSRLSISMYLKGARVKYWESLCASPLCIAVCPLFVRYFVWFSRV